MEKKTLFFDIDGTLWDYERRIPDSTRKTIDLLHRNGHRVFINSGRSKGHITAPELLGMGFDGIVSGCGTTIEYQGEIVFLRLMDNDFTAHIIETVRQYGFRPILEGTEYLYMDPEEFKDDPYGQKLSREMGDRIRPIRSNWKEWKVVKFSCDTEHADRENCFRILSKDFELLIHNEKVVECVPLGFSKGTGIQKVCELLDLDIRDTIAIGDSVNDLGMFRTAGLSIVLGQASDEIKKEADYVTTSLWEDGIYNACRHFELV